MTCTPHGACERRCSASRARARTASSPAVLVVQGGEQPAQRCQGIGRGSAVGAGVHAVPQRPHLDDACRNAAQARGDGRRADLDVVRVGQHDHVRDELVPVLGEQVAELGRADLFLAFDEHGDADRRGAVEGSQRGQVHRDAGLVVGRPAGVQPPVALARLERGRRPGAGVAGWLDVVVGIQQHRRHAVGRGVVADHRRLAALDIVDDLDVGATCLPQQRGGEIGALPDLGSCVRVGAHRRDPDQRLEIVADGRQHLADGLA